MLRDGGNAVDAALAAMLTSFVAEPLLTGLGAGGYMLVAAPGGEPVLLDFFVEAPGRGADGDARGELVPVDVSFGDAVQVFHVGAASVGAYGMPAGHLRGAPALRHRAARRARRARGRRSPARAWRSTRQQAYVVRDPRGDHPHDARGRARCSRPTARCCARARSFAGPELGDALERLGAEGAAPFYTGDIAAAVVALARTGAAAMLTARGPRRLRGGRARAGARRATAGARSSPTRRRRAGGIADRARAGAARRAPTARRRPRTLVDGDGGRAGRAHAGVPRRPAEPGSPSASSPRGWARRRTSRSSTPTAGRAR